MRPTGPNTGSRSMRCQRHQANGTSVNAVIPAS
jgi:hypothetical protein